MEDGLRSGSVLDGRYRLEHRLGEGGMGAVWVARQIALERDVALKVLRDATPEMRPRLRREALALAAVHHPAIVQVHDYGESEEGVPFVVMELVRGESLAAHLARAGALPADEAAALMLPLLDGLAAAHDAGIVHRDVKPENVLLAAGAAGVTPKLVDFGIASITRGDAAATTGGLLGTPAYMAPEQVLGRLVDARADVWGAGVLLYELIAGERPFGAEAIFTVMHRVVHDPPSYPKRARGLDGRLWAILMNALRKDPAERISSAAAFREALVGWLAGRVPSPRPAAPLHVVAATTTLASPRAPLAPTLPAASQAPSDDASPSFDALIRAKLGG
jgi:serine/threonine protein kinase